MTLAVVVVFGALTGMDAARIAAGEPTPLARVVERINIGAFLLWVVVLAVPCGARGWAQTIRSRR